MFNSLRRIVLIALVVFSSYTQAGFLDFIKDIDPAKLSLPSAAQSTNGLSNADIVSGLKQALEKGTQVAVQNLSAEGGFLNHPDVRIPLPSFLQPIASPLRMLGQGHFVDEFQTTLNRAAEQATPEAIDIFTETIQQMSIDDAVGILQGPDNAATEYFKTHSAAKLRDKLLPIVTQTTNSAGVTASYKNLIANSGNMSTLVASQVSDLDKFITHKTVQSIFLRIAEQEKLIRENPAARTTDLLKKVFTP